MERLSTYQCKNWFNVRNMIYTEKRVITPSVIISRSEKIPEDSGARIAKIKNDLEALKGKNIFLLFTGWSVWPSGEWVPLFNAINTLYGSDEQLIDFPGYIFNDTEFNKFMNYCVLGIIFLWDFFCCVDDGTVYGYSNDEYQIVGKIETVI